MQYEKLFKETLIELVKVLDVYCNDLSDDNLGKVKDKLKEVEKCVELMEYKGIDCSNRNLYPGKH